MGMILRVLWGAFDGLAFALGAMCLAAAVAAHGGRFSGRLDILTHFAPFWLAGALLALAYGAFQPAGVVRLLIVGVGGLGVICAAALIVPEFLRPLSPRAPADAPRQLKIVQLNGWVRNHDVEGTAAWIAAQNPDIVVVEEIKDPLREAILRRLPYNYSRGMLQTAIFSRAVPLHKPFELDRPWDDWPGLVRARLPAPDGQPFDLIGLHYGWPTNGWQKTQRNAIAGLVAKYDRRRLIVVGDFNLTPWSFALRRQDAQWGMERRSRALFSWPVQPFARGRARSPVPFLPIDQVYAGPAWRTVSIETGPRIGSDHLPVVVKLALAD